MLSHSIEIPCRNPHKAAVYKDSNTQGSWASRGVDRWYLGPSHNHYRCNIYYIPETEMRKNWILGLTKLFLQHCQLPDMTPHQHLRALTNKLRDCSAPASSTPKGKCLLHMLTDRIAWIYAPPPMAEEQWVGNDIRNEVEQRVIDDTPIIHIRTWLMHRVLWNHTILWPNGLLNKLLTSIGKSRGTTPQA